MSNFLTNEAEVQPDRFNPPERVLRRMYGIYLEGGRSVIESLYEAGDRAHVSDGLWIHCVSILQSAFGKRHLSFWKDSTQGMSRTSAKRYLKRALDIAARSCPNSRPPSKNLDPGLNSEARV